MNGRKLGKKFRKYLEGIQDESIKLLKVFIKTAKKVIGSGGTVSFEWPAYCLSWHIPGLDSFFDHYGFDFAVCHGCAFGLKHRGQPIKKSWKIASTHGPIIKRLSKYKCHCNQGRHCPCIGKLASESEKYKALR